MACPTVPYTTYYGTTTFQSWAPTTATRTATSYSLSTLSYGTRTGQVIECGPVSTTRTFVITYSRAPTTIGYTATTTVPVTTTLTIPTATITEPATTTLYETLTTTSLSEHTYYTATISYLPPLETRVYTECIPTLTTTKPYTFPYVTNIPSPYLTTTTYPVQVTTTSVFPTKTVWVTCPWTEKREDEEDGNLVKRSSGRRSTSIGVKTVAIVLLSAMAFVYM